MVLKRLNTAVPSIRLGEKEELGWPKNDQLTTSTMYSINISSITFTVSFAGLRSSPNPYIRFRTKPRSFICCTLCWLSETHARSFVNNPFMFACRLDPVARLPVLVFPLPLAAFIVSAYVEGVWVVAKLAPRLAVLVVALLVVGVRGTVVVVVVRCWGGT